jgi:bifunctional DNA-binding transcriptional regulator/antitoxin component of YhaV-PrlF toxin-antitoxin module
MTMTATQPKSQKATEGKVYRAKVTGRHAITLPAELCRQLGIEVGDSVEFVLQDDVVTFKAQPIPHISSLRGILKPYFPDSESIREFLEEERAGLDERDAFLDQIWEGKWSRDEHSSE